MSQITKELGEINRIVTQLEKDFKSDVMKKHEYYDLDLRYRSASARLINSAVQIAISDAKHGKRIKHLMDRTNIYSITEAVNTGDPEIEMVKCLDKDDALITRGECLSFSGSTENMETCKSCMQFEVTRKVIPMEKV